MNTLHTERLLLRPFVPEDASALHAYLSLPEVVRYEPYDVHTLRECEEEAVSRANEGDANRFWAVCLKDGGALIGHIYFAQDDPPEFRTWELGYVFHPAHGGKGYATEACQRILAFGFIEKNAHRIIAGVNVENTASWRLLERLSMRREAHMLQKVFFKRREDGTPIWNDSYHYAMLSTEFAERGGWHAGTEHAVR